jgi:prepilin-type N-terminal cleavage/methylation domain-containing protein/prepilin-type processing-associated H-X9-DG protein
MARCSRRSGFTLIELLVVIAIIAILAAILFPVFAQARQKARAALCLSQSKQIGIAVHMYTQDYDETLPQAYLLDAPASSKVKPTPVRGFHVILQPYVKSQTVFLCPSDPDKVHPLLVYWGPSFPLSFLPNYAILSPDDYTPVRMAAIDEPANTIILVEGRMKNIGGLGVWGYGGAEWQGGRRLTDAEMQAGSISPKPRVAYDRHLGGSDYIFADGHAKWLRWEQTFQPTWLWGPPSIASWLQVNKNANSYR